MAISVVDPLAPLMRQVLVRLSLVLFCPERPSSPLVTAVLKLIICSGLRMFTGTSPTKLSSMTTLRSGRSVVSSGAAAETDTTSFTDAGFSSIPMTFDSANSRANSITWAVAKPGAVALIS